MTDNLIIIRTDGHVNILHLSGHLDASTENILLNHARLVKDSGARFLLVDLSDVEMITSAGLRALHQGFKMFTPNDEIEIWHKENPGEVYKSPYFKLAGASPQVYYVLNLAGFLQNLAIYPSAQDAMASFEKP